MRKKIVQALTMIVVATLASSAPCQTRVEPKFVEITDWVYGSGCPTDPKYQPTVAGNVTLTVNAAYRYTSGSTWEWVSGSSQINYTYTFAGHSRGDVKFWAKNVNIPPGTPTVSVVYPHNTFDYDVAFYAECEQGAGDG
jgi:hypothetical protein